MAKSENELTPENIRRAILRTALLHTAFVCRPLPIPAVALFEAELERMHSEGLIFGASYAPLKEPRLTEAGLELARRMGGDGEI